MINPKIRNKNKKYNFNTNISKSFVSLFCNYLFINDCRSKFKSKDKSAVRSYGGFVF